MSLQVGRFCYASPVDAGAAACAQYAPVSEIVNSGLDLKTVSCSGSDPVTGALLLDVTTTPLDGSPGVSSAITHQISYSPCQETDYLAAFQTLAGTALGAFFVCYGIWRVYKFITSNSRVDA